MTVPAGTTGSPARSMSTGVRAKSDTASPAPPLSTPAAPGRPNSLPSHYPTTLADVKENNHGNPLRADDRNGELYPVKSHFVVVGCFDGTLIAYFKDATAISR